MRLRAMLAFAAVVNACPATPASANRDALRQIVQEQCVVQWLQAHSPRPCERIFLPDAAHARDGYAVLADRKGGAHFLLIPTRTVAGMESPELLEPGTPNYFAAAWDARDLVAAVVGHRISRGAVGLALNPPHARTQDQFHIHIECMREDVARVLQKSAPQVTAAWSGVFVGGWRYQVLRVMGEDLRATDPIALLAHELTATNSRLGDYTLVVVGMDFKEGPGFMLLAGTGPAGELLLDSTCAIAEVTAPQRRS